MALIFQYGSNMSIARLNGKDRLCGDAKPIGVMKTLGLFELVFSVWSKTNNCAAADIVPCDFGKEIYGVVYDVPEILLSRNTAKMNNRISMDQIEGEGTNYVRRNIDLLKPDGSTASALTYVAKEPKSGLVTDLDYVKHILTGLSENNIPEEYRHYVRSRVIDNNPMLKTVLPL
jgi:cation transport regulator ChaC